MTEESSPLFNTEGLNDDQKTLLSNLTDEQKSLIASRAESETKNLLANRDKILEEKRLEEQKRKEIEEKLKLQDEQTTKIQAELEEAQRIKDMEEAEKSKDNERIKELQQQAFDKERKEYESKLTESEEKAKALLIEKNDLMLTTALSQSNITKDGFEAVKRLMQSRMALTDTNEILLEGLPMKDYLETWSESDEGKFFIKAPLASGSGAGPGSNGKGADRSWKELSVDERAQMRLENPEKATQLSSAS